MILSIANLIGAIALAFVVFFGSISFKKPFMKRIKEHKEILFKDIQDDIADDNYLDNFSIWCPRFNALNRLKRFYKTGIRSCIGLVIVSIFGLISHIFNLYVSIENIEEIIIILWSGCFIFTVAFLIFPLYWYVIQDEPAE